MDSYELSFGDQIIAVFDTGLPLFTFKLKEEINEEKLYTALLGALEKHPLYRSRLVLEGGLYKYAHNDLDPVITKCNWSDEVCYGVESNNFYPWIIMCDKNEIHFSAAHSLSDGGGASRFIKSVLVLYLEMIGKKFSTNIDIDVEDAHRTTELSGEKHIDEEDEGPIMGIKEKPIIDTSPDLYENDPEKISAYNITFNINDIKAMASKSETTNFAALAAILAIAYDKMLDLPEGNIKVEVPFDLRGFWDSVSDHNFVAMASLYYNVARLKGKSIDLVQTAFRSQLDIHMDVINQVRTFNQEFRMKQMLKADPSMLVQMTKDLTDRLFLPKASIVLTHLGNLGFPKELMEEIVDYRLTSGVFPGSMMAAVGFAHNDKITLNMIQATKGDIYIEKMEEVLKEHDIPYSCEKIVPHGKITFVVPRE